VALHLSIVTPAAPIVETEVDTVVLPGAEGQFGVLEQHELLLAPLKEGVLTYAVSGQTRAVEIAGGFAEVTHGAVTVLADDAQPVSLQ